MRRGLVLLLSIWLTAGDAEDLMATQLNVIERLYLYSAVAVVISPGVVCHALHIKLCRDWKPVGWQRVTLTV